MKHKQTLAMLLAAAMVLSMPLGAYAQGTAEGENSTDSVQPYVVDTEAPTISKISLSKTEVDAGETIIVTIEGKDDVSGIKNFIAYFENAEGKSIHSNFSSFSGNVMEAEIEISEYEASGEYHLDFIEIYDNANNSRSYSNKEGNHYEALPNDLSFNVKNNQQEDTTAPTISKISLDKTEINAGESLKVSIEGKDNLSGIKNFIAYFENAEGRIINSNFSSFSGNVMEAEMEISEYEASGEYHLDFIEIYDNANNSRSYSNKEGNHYEALPNDLSFTVINDDPVTPPTQPEQPTPDHKPSRPGSSDGNNSANSSNASGVVNYESEKPDPADKQAVKAYNFWQDAKSKIRKTAEGKTLRLNVPKEITNLPASVMETLRKENVSLRLNWNGKTITIPAGKAQPKQKLRIYWTMQTLEKLYNA